MGDLLHENYSIAQGVQGTVSFSTSSSKSRDRTELVVLITPKVVNNPEQARQVTAEYRQQMQLLKAQAAGS